MDQHPIPQDVTGFQFKLIGTMTVKQFGYVASGVVLAVVLYYLPIQSAFAILIKVLLIPLLGVSGVIVAFVPIDGRPIDIMATNFAKALFSPNQYVYRRQGRTLSFSTVSITKASDEKTAAQKRQTPAKATNTSGQLNEKEEKLRAFLLNSKGAEKNEVDKKEAAFLKTLSIPTIQPDSAVVVPQPAQRKTPSMTKPPTIVTAPTPQPKIVQAAPVPVKAVPQAPITTTKTPENEEKDLSQKEIQLEQALTQAKQEESTNQAPAIQAVAHHKVETLSKQIQEIHTQKLQLEQELAHLQTQLTQQKHPQLPQTPKLPLSPTQDPQHVRTISQTITKKVGLPHVSDTPNVVVGIVKDPRGNVLTNILVEVKDKDGNPVRAFKTNPLGQFASATPLSVGTYTIELEDPKKQHRFDTIQVTANNQIMLPIEIISHDAREDLRKQLFTT